MNKLYQTKKLKAFTLTEVLVVLVIVGILVLLALPNLLPLITKAKSTEAKVQLEHLYTLEKNYFYEHSKYSNDLNAVSFVQEKLSTEGDKGQANYRVEIVEASTTTFVARATAVVDFDGDGTFNVWEIDQDKNLREVVQD
ncbi:prepilin-type N-terminal cleavage/methylation domain-containing protein [Solitalea canadensis]|uniref:Prepilin-type N-terminal cleavage/methylation domain-containing protein n=1 Tax=Solitalea canadensis (strain ATCC 29591 / DSM 3403 / JCM 21819 / LMG 8368 / NBRC 15130 / NCIMB 12057 / USAM 9D) TaxID=929556 RepID=H8KTR1_SOLCM|nr:prepilin-type N-terminal cleavage/methylation domain-containing protein [Solitalea canadensis]AFD06636.1 prepilin-type N-terminal cleavage/methylation domain-containing protein [Solitalea canadensis DSM 3403]